MKERISLLVKALNYTSAQFAEEINVQKSAISHIMSGRNNPSLDFIQKIIIRFPEVSIDWLMFGKGPIFKDRDFIPETTENKLFKDQIQEIKPHEDLFSALDIESDTENLNLKGVNQQSGLESNEGFSNQPADSTPGHKNVNPKSSSEKNPIPLNIIEKNNKELNDSRLEEKSKKVERVIIFYSDKTFSEYRPE